MERSDPASAVSLIDQTERLLQQLRSETADRSLQALGCELAVACHGRMRALEQQDRWEAIRHALAGVELIRLLRDQQASLPDWLATYEEQLCRHGGLWIHQGVVECADGGQEFRIAQLASRGADLLARLNQIHGGRHAWIHQHLAALQTAAIGSLPQPAATHTGAPTIAVAGNCQAWPLFLDLKHLLPTAQLHHCPPVHLATAEQVQAFQRLLPSVDLLLMHRIQPGYRDDIGLDNQTLGRHMAAGARLLVLPNLHYEGHHPWIGYAHDPEGGLARIQASSPMGPYHDFLAMQAARRDLSAEQLLDRPLTPDLASLIRQHHQASLEQLRRREVDCDVEISSWIDQQHRRQPLLHTFNHPTRTALRELLMRAMATLHLTAANLTPQEDAKELLGQLAIPILPWVREALGLADWAKTWGHRNGNSHFGIDLQLSASIAFYREHPWIATQNQQRPKARFAASALDCLLG